MSRVRIPPLTPRVFDLCARSSVRIERQPPELKVPRSNRGGRTILLRSSRWRSGASEDLRYRKVKARLERGSVTYVYLLRSVSNPKKTYVGSTSNADGRLDQHNAGESPYSSVSPLAAGLKYRVSGSPEGDGVRAISQVGFRSRVCEPPFLVKRFD